MQEAITYYTNKRTRMRYPEYRAGGSRVGVGQWGRLKHAGMLRTVDGARAVATVRTWLKSGRWREAMALRPPRLRSYRRQAA